MTEMSEKVETNGSLNSIGSETLKICSLLSLTFQRVLLGLSMRYSRARSVDMFFSGTAVLMAELVKLITCFFILYVSQYKNPKDVNTIWTMLTNMVTSKKLDTLKVWLLSLIYLIQNNLFYIETANLDAATAQITNQLKIITTAIFSVLILKKKLIITQWLSLVVLMIGIIVVQLSVPKENKEMVEKESRVPNQLLGFCAGVTSCVLSGFAGVYFEKVLKKSDESIWTKNFQLSLLSLPLGLFTCWANHSQGIETKGFFFGYDFFVVYLIFLNGLGGLLVAVVIKHADAILKGFATSVSIIITGVVSMYYFGLVITLQFVIGGLLVILSIFMYAYIPSSSPCIIEQPPTTST